MSDPTPDAVDLTGIEAVLRERQRLAAEQKQVKEKLAELDERIKAAWGGAEEAVVTVAGERQKVGTWGWVESRVLDQTLLKSRYPDAVTACTTTRRARTFRMTWEPPAVDPLEPYRDVTVTHGSTGPKFSEWDDE